MVRFINDDLDEEEFEIDIDDGFDNDLDDEDDGLTELEIVYKMLMRQHKMSMVLLADLTKLRNIVKMALRKLTVLQGQPKNN